jgi:hypothetical protein
VTLKCSRLISSVFVPNGAEEVSCDVGALVDGSTQPGAAVSYRLRSGLLVGGSYIRSTIVGVARQTVDEDVDPVA